MTGVDGVGAGVTGVGAGVAVPPTRGDEAGSPANSGKRKKYPAIARTTRTTSIPAMIFGSGLPFTVPADTGDTCTAGVGELTGGGDSGIGDSTAAPQLSQNFLPSVRTAPQLVQNFCPIQEYSPGD